MRDAGQAGPVHPIELESFRLIDERVDLGGLPPGPRAVVARVIHASADLEYASTVSVDEAAVEAGVSALASEAPVLCDVQMVRHGITGAAGLCYLDEVPAPAARGATRAAAAMAVAARRHPSGAVVAVGCAPTALREVIRLAAEEGFDPALVVAMPVGFVGAADAKAELRASPLASISNVGDKGGSAVTAAAVNALARLAREALPR